MPQPVFDPQVYIAVDVDDCGNAQGTYYVGSTTNIERRFREHRWSKEQRRELLESFDSTGLHRFQNEAEFMEYCRAFGLPMSNKQNWQSHSEW